MKVRFGRKQYIEIELKREPTAKEKLILLGQNENETMVDLPNDLIDFDKGEVVDEDYSFDENIHFNEIGVDAPELI